MNRLRTTAEVQVEAQADEVRQLAERTADATGEIEDVIIAIQDETKEAVRSIQNGRNEVEEGIELADQAGDTFQRILYSTGDEEPPSDVEAPPQGHEVQRRA